MGFTPTSAPDSSRVSRWPTVSWRVLSFLGGFSFLGAYSLPTRSLALFFLTPALGPLLLALAGVLAMLRSRAISSDPALRPGRLFVVALVSCAILFVPVALLDFLLFIAVPYVGLLIALFALPIHLVSAGTLATGIYALSKAEANPALAAKRSLPAVAGLLAGIALAFVRIQFVPSSHGVFLKAFAASHGLRLCSPEGACARTAHRTIASTGTARYRGHDTFGHEPRVPNRFCSILREHAVVALGVVRAQRFRELELPLRIVVPRQFPIRACERELKARLLRVLCHRRACNIDPETRGPISAPERFAV